MSLTREEFGATRDGTPVERYTLTSPAGVAAEVMTYGATLVSLRGPDRAGRAGEVLLGFDTLAPYLAGHPYLGSTVGRYGNRIADGRFALDGVSYTLAVNNGPNHLHGGLVGFDKVVWQAQPLDDGDAPAVELRYLSRDGEEGYPGTLTVSVTFALDAAGALRLDYVATTDAPTVVNLTNHAYFNLAGSGDILGHELQIPATHMLPTNAVQIPTGERRAVAGSIFDFRTPTAIGARIFADDEQLRFANGGYDHTWVLSEEGPALRPAATLYEPQSGRLLEVQTTEPGAHFYSGNFLDGSLVGRGGQAYHKHHGLCLEMQHFADSPNHPDFPSTTLRPGETYRQTTIYRLTAR